MQTLQESSSVHHLCSSPLAPFFLAHSDALGAALIPSVPYTSSFVFLASNICMVSFIFFSPIPQKSMSPVIDNPN